MISYVLTVSVSVAAGVVALTSAYPALNDYEVPLGIGVIVIVTLVNLRGIRESSTIFMIPTYAFLVCIGALLVVGLPASASVRRPSRAWRSRRPAADAPAGAARLLLRRRCADRCRGHLDGVPARSRNG